MPSRDVARTEYLFSLSKAEVDALPFGMITLDESGIVIEYNAAESRLSGLAPERVIGRNFFSDVAPCTKVRAFAGLYGQMAEDGEPEFAQFEFVFRFANGDKKVMIWMAFLKELRRGVILVEERKPE